MKKIMMILMCCAFVLCIGNAAIADDDIVKRHDNWVKKTIGAGQAANKPTPSGVRALKEDGDQNKEHTIAVTLNISPESKQDIKTLQIGDFTLHLVKVCEAYNDDPYHRNTYIYTFKGDPNALASAIVNTWRPPQWPPVFWGESADKIRYGEPSPYSGVETSPRDLTKKEAKDLEKDILPRKYAGLINGFNINGDFLLSVKSKEDLQHILKHYDVSLAQKWSMNGALVCLLQADDPKAAARIMNDIMNKGLAKWAEFNNVCRIYLAPFNRPIVYTEYDQKTAVEQEVTLRSKDRRFTGQMAGEPKEVIPLQKKN